MTPLKARQERFCRRFVEFANATVAARAAGYSPEGANRAGYRLLRHPRVARRIAEIEAETARLHSRDGDVLVGKLENVYRRAIIDHQFHAAARDAESESYPEARPEGGAGPQRSPAHRVHSNRLKKCRLLS